MGAIGKIGRPTLVAFLLAVIGGGARADLAAELRTCAEIEEDGRRLACFDALATTSFSLTFAGFGNGSTDVFEITAPSTLEYASDDVVLVVYLQDDAGQLVQNLHLGGQGKAEYRIEEPGRYQLQVDATGGWRMRIFPGRRETP
ncbi:MAG: hypothetical protein MI920_12205 [Kiloniellales bacterium]|nr:hypothetical protein [Kiloniellales bacterium]